MQYLGMRLLGVLYLSLDISCAVVFMTFKAEGLKGCSHIVAYKIAMEMSVRAGDAGDVVLSDKDIGMLSR